MGYGDKGDKMVETYSINHRTWKWTKKLFFHLFDLTILNSYILFPSLRGKKISLRDFEDQHPLQSLDQFNLKNVAGNIGLFRLPHKDDVTCVRPGVSPEKLK